MTYQLPPVVKLAERLMLEIEQAVRLFPRYHKFAAGARLRDQVFDVVKLAHQAWREREQRHARITDLDRAVSDLKLLLQLCSQLRAFTSFAQFEALSRIAYELGRQVGGWRKQHPKGQDAQPRMAGQRAQTLSTGAASIGANA